MGKTKLDVEPGKQEFVYTRIFDAPPELVFRAFSDPGLLCQWLGPNRLTMKSFEMEARPGGSWRFVQGDPEGNEYGFHGVIHALEAPRLIIQTFEFEGEPNHVSLETATFSPEPGGKTRVTGHSVFQSVEDRDGMIGAGMEGGMNEGLDRLDEILAHLH